MEEQAEKNKAECEKQRDEYLAGWQRAKADFLNYKKEEMQRLEEFLRYGNEELIKEFIAVLDSFDLGLAALQSHKEAPTSGEARVGVPTLKAVGIEKGVYMIRSHIEDILKKYGLARIPIKLGELFDPSVAEAIAEVESDTPAGTVLEEIEPGYRLHDKVIRAARVKVSKG